MESSILETQQSIKAIKTIFEQYLTEKLYLMRVSAPKFIRTNTGIQDDLAQTCESVKFNVPSCGFDVEIVHSLAKWKRIALERYGIPIHYGIYTDMDAIRKDEQIDFMHSIYVDQWDWEIHIEQQDRTEKFLKYIVKKIYDAIKQTALDITRLFRNSLPEKIKFIHTEELETLYPELTQKQRENVIAKKYGAVFLIGIGYPLKDGKPHDIRAFDYDDWSTQNSQFNGLNGDIIVWNEITQCAFELSSMGIRVDKNALIKQAQIMQQSVNTDYHDKILKEKIPFSIGGGIGQSRLCMFLLGKKHIGEVQVSEWSDKMIQECNELGIQLL
jgi:aspartate--ammonia ligase